MPKAEKKKKQATKTTKRPATKKPPPKDELVSRRELARRLKVDPQTICKAITNSRIPPSAIDKKTNKLKAAAAIKAYKAGADPSYGKRIASVDNDLQKLRKDILIKRSKKLDLENKALESKLREEAYAEANKDLTATARDAQLRWRRQSAIIKEKLLRKEIKPATAVDSLIDFVENILADASASSKKKMAKKS